MTYRYRSLLAIACTFFASALFAQIPNPSFETWADGLPTGWRSVDNDTVNVLPTNDAHQGNMAVRIIGNKGIQTKSATGTPWIDCSCRPGALHYWYKMSSSNGNGFIVNFSGRQNGSPVAVVSVPNTTVSAVYKEDVVNINYFTPGNLEQFSIWFTSTASELIIDDLSFGSATNVDNLQHEHAGIENIFPNPANKAISIVYHLAMAADVQLNIYDAFGRLVLHAVNERQSPGRYKATPDISLLANGLYTARLETNGMVVNKAFAVAR